MHPESNSQKSSTVQPLSKSLPFKRCSFHSFRFVSHSHLAFRYLHIPPGISKKMNHVRSTLSSSHINHPLLSSPSSYSPSLFSISLSFHSPFKVLFSFRSHYLFSIGLSAMFSFSGSLPRSFTLDSQRTRLFLPLCLFAPSLWLFFKKFKIRVSHPLCLFSPAFQQASRLLATLSGLGKSSFLFPNLRIQSFFKRALSNASPMPFFPNRIISA